MRLVFIFLMLSTGLLITNRGNAQNTISGQVRDAKYSPLVGVTIREKGTGNVTVTNAQGKFTLILSKPTAILVASYAGYVSHEIDVTVVPGQEFFVNIKLDTSPTDLRFWCCLDHKAPDGPHCDMDKEVLKTKFKCKNFERQ